MQKELKASIFAAIANFQGPGTQFVQCENTENPNPKAEGIHVP